MGCWTQYDGTVIGDELADIVGESLDEMVGKLVKKFPEITKNQVLHTIAFCGSYLRHFDKGRKLAKKDKLLLVLPARDRDKYCGAHRVPEDETKLLAPGTGLMNVRNPFEVEPVESI